MKVLELSFLSEAGKTARVSIEQPVEPLDSEQVKTAMAEMLASDVFTDSEGNRFVAAKSARIVERNVTDIELN